MYKRGLVDLEQTATFGDLTISWLGEEEDHDYAGPVEEYQG
jgi:chromatin segregation and condensation protein Rec8/ScpA/Scc1 (kleisin family)